MVSEKTSDMAARYNQRLARYTTAMRNEMPDMIPIRPFVAEFTGVYAGYTCQELAHDYEKAFAAARKCAADFDWDAVVPNMVYGWMGLVKAISLKYYACPGIELPPETPFQYLEPSENEAWMQSGENAAWMRADEYDELIRDPTGYLFNVWLPRVAEDVSPMGQPTSYRNNLSFVRGGMAMMQYFGGFGAGSDFTWNLLGGLGYEWRFDTWQLEALLGGRALYQDFNDGSGLLRFEWDVTQYGPVVALGFRF